MTPVRGAKEQETCADLGDTARERQRAGKNERPQQREQLAAPSISALPRIELLAAQRNRCLVLARVQWLVCVPVLDLLRHHEESRLDVQRILG